MIDAFLTAYDPSDLPGKSVDPLGFGPGYLFLAEKILPGLTNAARRPRYFSLLCLGISCDSSGGDLSPRESLRRRRETLLRVERFWALGNVLARGGESSSGVRGVTYARDRAEEIAAKGILRTKANYLLLSRQPQYGALGVYASVADGMRFFNSDTLTLTPDLGEVIAEAFASETQLPAALRRAMIADDEAPVNALRSWGERAHVAGNVGAREARCLNDALHFDLVRSRMAKWLKRFPAQNSERQLPRLRRIAHAMKASSQDKDLSESIRVILAYEKCYAEALLGFERLLWLCRNHATGSLSSRDLASDVVVRRATAALALSAPRLEAALDATETEHLRERLQTLDDVREFLRQATPSASEFVELLLARHADVQRGKFDRGRRKMPWLEWRTGQLELTMTRVGGLPTEAQSPDDIEPHPYRLEAADNLLGAAQARR